VDDKINARAAERLAQRGEASGDLNAEIRRLTEETYANFKADVAALGCLPPTVEPRATEHIEEMKALIERLVASGHAYVAEDHVLFAVASMPDYGRFSKRPLDEMIAGARVEVAPYKRDAMDFVLWKPSKPGEPAWPSPCGIAAPGRPGWHIECSAMSDHWLWTKAEPRLSAAGLAHPHQFDIHGGGVDLVFPHHENEIAQSRCGFHTPVMANYWMHNGFLMVEGEKMAKSLGNFITIRDVLKDWPGEVVRFNMLKTHYRQPVDWTEKGLAESKKTLDHWYGLLEPYGDIGTGPVDADFQTRLLDDLNTPGAIAELHRLTKQITGSVFGDFAHPIEGPALLSTFRSSAQMLGLLTDNSFGTSWRAKLGEGDYDKELIESFIEERSNARRARDFKKADRIRDELLAMGIALKDSKDPETGELITNWEPV
jgi:cysteinyl-tRNA synthetase